MATNRIIQFFSVPIGDESLAKKIQRRALNAPDKRPFELIKKMIQAEHKKLDKVRTKNKIRDDFWDEGLAEMIEVNNRLDKRKK